MASYYYFSTADFKERSTDGIHFRDGQLLPSGMTLNREDILWNHSFSIPCEENRNFKSPYTHWKSIYNFIIHTEHETHRTRAF